MSDPLQPGAGPGHGSGSGPGSGSLGGEEDRKVCAVCGRILNSYDPPEGDRSWLHTFADLPEDHPAVPVPVGAEIIARTRCDFCNDDNPAWEIPATSFIIPGLTVELADITAGNGSRGNWAACDPCAQLIARNEWTALRRRVLTAASAHTTGGADGNSTGHSTDGSTGGVDGQLARLYRLLRRHITGPPRQSTPNQPPDQPPKDES